MAFVLLAPDLLEDVTAASTDLNIISDGVGGES